MVSLYGGIELEPVLQYAVVSVCKHFLTFKILSTAGGSLANLSESKFRWGNGCSRILASLEHNCRSHEKI